MAGCGGTGVVLVMLMMEPLTVIDGQRNRSTLISVLLNSNDVLFTTRQPEYQRKYSCRQLHPGAILFGDMLSSDFITA